FFLAFYIFLSHLSYHSLCIFLIPPPPTAINPLSLHDALPICGVLRRRLCAGGAFAGHCRAPVRGEAVGDERVRAQRTARRRLPGPRPPHRPRTRLSGGVVGRPTAPAACADGAGSRTTALVTQASALVTPASALLVRGVVRLGP